MKKIIFILFIIVIATLSVGCSNAETAERKLDAYYAELSENEAKLTDTQLSDDEINVIKNSIETLNRKIKSELRAFAVDIYDETLDLAEIPFAADDNDAIGKWYYSNLIYPLYYYEEDYSALTVNDFENFTSQEKFHIICYHLNLKNNELLTEKYSFLRISATLLNKLSVTLFGEAPDPATIPEYDKATNTYSIPAIQSDRLLSPIFNGTKSTGANRLEVTVYYAEKTMTKVIYTEAFVFERLDESGFFIDARTRNNKSFFLSDEVAAAVEEDSICFLELEAVEPAKLKNENKSAITEFLSVNYSPALDNYGGTIASSDYLSVPSLLNMLLLLQPDINTLIENNIDKYTYFGISPEFFDEQISYWFGSVIIEKAESENYSESFDVYLYKISDILPVYYHKEEPIAYELENGYIRLETSIYSPDIVTQFIAREVVIFSPNSDSSFSVVSKRYNIHLSTPLNSVFADIFPVYPDPYPVTSQSLTAKGLWLYENYSPLISAKFTDVSRISSETLAIFAIERIFETEAFRTLYSEDNNYAFPTELVEEQIKLFFGETSFNPEFVSFYDLHTGLFCVNGWTVNRREASGKVISVPNSRDGVITIYVENDSGNGNFTYESYSFQELSDKTFRFVSASVSE